MTPTTQLNVLCFAMGMFTGFLIGWGCTRNHLLKNQNSQINFDEDLGYDNL